MSTARLHELIKAADRLPPHLRDWLQGGFEQWREGNDLAAALELYRPGLDQRDEWLQMAIALCPGESDTAKCAFFLDCLDGRRQHPETTGQHLIEKLINEPVKVRLSIKQLQRILKGRRTDGWRHNPALCPSPRRLYGEATISEYSED